MINLVIAGGIFLCFGGFITLIVFTIAKSVQQTTARRQALSLREVAILEQVRGLQESLGVVDEKTAERTQSAIASIHEKLHKARAVQARGRERDFVRAENILAQCEAKIENARGGVARSTERLRASEERRTLRATELEARKEAQRQERAAQREAQREAQRQARQAERAAQRGSFNTGVSRGSFGNVGTLSGRNTDWNTVSRTERGVCFFCARPAYLRELAPITLTVAGRPQRVLACRDDYLTYRGGHLPPVRSFYVEDHYIPWYAYTLYDPYSDYYGQGYDNPDQQMVDRYPMEELPPEAWNWQSDAGNFTEGEYTFTPDNEIYRDYYSQEASSYPDFDPSQAASSGGTSLFASDTLFSSDTRSDSESETDFGSEDGFEDEATDES